MDSLRTERKRKMESDAGWILINLKNSSFLTYQDNKCLKEKT